MSSKNFQAIKETSGTNASEDKSEPRMINSSYPGGISKADSKKPATFGCDIEGKTCANNSKIPRPPLTTSNSFNATLKNNQSEGKTKKPPSMIPRSRSRRRGENDKVKLDTPTKIESARNQINDTTVSNNKKLQGDLADQPKSRGLLPPHETPSTPFVLEMTDEKNNLGKKFIKLSSLSLKSCQDFLQGTKEAYHTLFEGAHEEISLSYLDEKDISKGRQESSVPQSADIKDNDALEATRQERTIRQLYDTLKCTFGPMLDHLKCVNHESIADGETEKLHFDSTLKRAVNTYESVPDFSSVQGHYEFTLKEISNIWKNTISLIASVREHAVKFVEGDNKLIDKEQLTLEAEMLQLALDFAISYSKLKTDFLIQLVRNRLDVKSPEKTELENFMDFKTFPASYNNDDLAAMARTVQDLNVSLLKEGEDQELD